jgi:UDP-N-acetylmuramoylalanine--D-glutamate ligase
MLTIESLALQGKSNIYDSLASGMAVRVLEIKKDFVKESFSDFRNVEHRLENVNNIHGIEFINDSKATNINSTWWALECMTKHVIWIAGGQDKSCNYAMLEEVVRKKVKAIVCLGIDNKKLIKAFGDDVKMIVETSSMAEALKYSYKIAEPGDVVLLSPGCASYDLFEDYEDRGRQFKKLVKEF